MDKSEVLVHISTPTTRASDDLYRSLADAYLAFEPHRPNEIPVDNEALSEAISSRGQAFASDTAPTVLRSMDSYGSFPSHLSSTDHPNDQHHSESHEIHSSPEDISISRLQRLECIQTRWREQRTPRSSLANSRRPSSSASILPDGDSTFIEDTQQAFRAIESQLPDQLSSTSEESSEDEADDSIIEDVTLGANEVAGSGSNRTPFMPSSGNVQAESHIDVAQYQEQPCIHKSITEAAIEKQVQPPSSQHSAISVNPADKDLSEVGHLEAPAHQVDFHTLPSVVCPPAPEVTVMSPGTLPSQITPYLQKLKQQNLGRFKPKSVSRALEMDERGHWRVDCRLWPEHVQQQFWIVLQKDIERGRLGWGITLHRDAVRMRLGLVRLYCWGELVEHVWLALWLHSGGRVWSTGAVWLDAEELEVVNIP